MSAIDVPDMAHERSVWVMKGLQGRSNLYHNIMSTGSKQKSCGNVAEPYVELPKECKLKTAASSKISQP
ncbi:hypothetical protein CTA1_2865 [Colletotrichum tanaceti]|uniref:Uncharacterized protein n=1 Tax=Colletotrichum tanaceti TaxID=1306861 RepID=A0A4U6XDU9_9PEZI|nr:hypothetical protein CTA1_2865 [Colletotrichum tanaceti]